MATVLQEAMRGFFGELLGIHVAAAAPDRVVAELFVRDELCTIPGVLHGGAVMALADQIGALATVLNLDRAKGYSTTTIESTTNFISPG
ncbi:MAG: PaaI family thioesterase, partial [Dehalococcoidia bacterium]|nr:PaaI family thioesterase [Dehalococcoidia bacterium]